MLGKIDKAMPGYFEARLLPGGVAMRRAADHSGRALEGRMVGAYGKRKSRLQQRPALMPVDVGLELDPCRIRPQAHGLHDLALLKEADDTNRDAMRAPFNDLDLACGDLCSAARVVVLDVPCIPVTRLVAVRPQLIAAIR